MREYFNGEDIIAGFYALKAGEKERNLGLVQYYSPPGIPARPIDGTVLDILQNTIYVA
ncbi:MAG: hypothetical protein ACXW4U_12255 [Anaerolineales bacterium]